MVNIINRDKFTYRNDKFNSYYTICYYFIENKHRQFFFGLINLDRILLKVSYEKLIIVSSCGIILIFFFKSLFSIFVNFCTYKFAYSLKKNISSRVLEKYLHQDYNFHIHSNSSRLLSSLTSDINAYNYSFVMPVITFLSESLIIVISILLIFFFGYYKIIYFF